MKKPKSKFGCSEIATGMKNACACDDAPLAVKNIELRKTIKGDLEVRLNKKGGWFPAAIDGNVLRFYA